METAKKSFTPPANKPILLPDIALPVFLAISFPQKRETRKLHGHQHRHEEGSSPERRLAPSIFRSGHTLAVTLLFRVRSCHSATYLQLISWHSVHSPADGPLQSLLIRYPPCFTLYLTRVNYFPFINTRHHCGIKYELPLIAHSKSSVLCACLLGAKSERYYC